MKALIGDHVVFPVATSMDISTSNATTTTVNTRKFAIMLCLSSTNYMVLASASKGKCISLCVDNKIVYEERLQLCHFSLIGRVFFVKGEKPCKLLDLRAKLQSV